MVQAAEKRRPPNAGKGRVKGTRNKLTTELKEMIEGALSDVGGRDYLSKQATESPAAFLALVGKLLPRDVNANVNATVDIRGWLQALGEPTD